MSAELNFVRQQGLQDASRESCAYQYPALMWQPRVLGVLALVGLILQPWPYFLALGALLWWNALVPALNPFDAAYNALVARPKGRPPLQPALGARRFAQGMAGTITLAIGLALWAGQQTAAWILEGFLVVALGTLIFGRFCLGSHLFLMLTGRGDEARRTLPWSGD